METLLSALWWIVTTLWALVWLLIGGWVSAALQIVVLVLAVFAYRYGWREAPYRAWRGARAVARWGWAWLRGAEAMAGEEAHVREVEVVRVVRVKELGDVSLSSLLNVSMLLGLALLAATA
ncbi:MAG: hypothetical protein JNM89_11530 [Hyphomicrobiaceae bacterium]|nr:hypothetical protein [Hyphomicrobiaceae bacterium]